MTKEIYIECMDKAVNAYSVQHMEAYTERVEKNGIEEHGFPRLTANLGILIAHGRQPEHKELFLRMMDICCREMPIALKKNGGGAANDFSVKEIVLCLLELEKTKIFDELITQKWRNALSAMRPEDIYTEIAALSDKPVGNWAVFGAASEQLRKYARLASEDAFIESQIEDQLKHFDENGMYREFKEPLVYDLVPRLQFAVILYFGYNGKSRKFIENCLLKSADITLEMQSVTGEIPFGGRSNQFLHDETFYAALCEFYAFFFKKRGDLNKAGAFKRAAHLAMNSVLPWLNISPVRHIKNKYPPDSGFGCEGYAYFDKYMATAASWLYLAYCMADDKIEETVCPAESPAENKGNAFEIGTHFHKVFLRFGDYFAEADTKADERYDASGLGKVQKRGAPPAICLAVPVSKTPLYGTDIENPSNLAVCAGIETDNGFEFAFHASASYVCTKKDVLADCVRAVFDITTESGRKIREEITVSDSGVEVSAAGDGTLGIMFPAFDFDGEEYAKIQTSETCVCVLYNGFKCEYKTDGKIVDLNRMYANRNGHYRAFCAERKGCVRLKIEIEKA